MIGRQSYWARNFVGWPRWSSITPNKTHLILSKWERAGRIHHLVTQNVDQLHFKAGSQRVVELHAYDVPCVVVHPLGGGSPAFLDWVLEQTDAPDVSDGEGGQGPAPAADGEVDSGLDGAPDAETDEATGETYFPIIVRTVADRLERGGEVHEIRPGMVASVDILTGERTVLDYLLKPFRKARAEALRER